MDTLITAANIIDGDPETIAGGQRATAPRPAAVLVRDNVIHVVGDLADVSIHAEPSATRLDFPGGTLLPGLINAHVHLCGDLSPQPFATAADGDHTTLTNLIQRNALSVLTGGCTTVRDLGDSRGLVISLRDQIDRGETLGPRILSSGTPLTIPQGHCWFLGGEVANHSQIDKHIEGLAAAKADWIKVMAGGGQMTPRGPSMFDSQFSSSDLAYIVRRASAYGTPVAAHAHATKTIKVCVDAGVHTIEHCGWWAAKKKMDLSDEIASKMATASIIAGDTAPPQWRMLADLLPFPDDHRIGDHLPWLRAHGVPILIGSDSGLPNAIFDDFPTSLEHYVERGFTRSEVITHVTGTAADNLRISEQTGRIRAGLYADLIVASGDPRDDLDYLRRLHLVMTRGHRVV
ncbi:amidohydrolase family protein [Pseudonocardia sp. ICBG1293]|uniref:amidohydrolase family protein n=1 Tax=Pseudonocardia sp. ICBG1293 TaxID=2844382 RepID=UPI001CCBA22A|nr:amidohydrolase family protein [Pseudonocardia sp. ICBG1293]